MPRITGLIHVCNQEREVARALESLRCCDEILVMDHGSKDGSLRVAREHGARIVQRPENVDARTCAQMACNDWILSLLPCEAVAEDLEASLLEWKAAGGGDQPGYNIRIREQIGTQWTFLDPELRLANRNKISWSCDFPVPVRNAPTLTGHILRIPNRYH